MNRSSKTDPITNKLRDSTSPYLQQHAHNPVDWHPWGQEALSKAKKENKPILVSIGYSACHWCHVMERESFEDLEVARIMNDHFISIKVDREERPDVDAIYMDAVQTMGLQGGWPLNVFLTPDQKPFYGGTYFPKTGWQQLLQQINLAFNNNRGKLEESAGKFAAAISTSAIKKYSLSSQNDDFDEATLKKGVERIVSRFDKTFGGQKKAPKFPMPSIWKFLLEYSFAFNNEDIRRHVIFTLEEIASGGIYDQVGGGFARYSVDEKWMVPHFEKMLYDNAQLLGLYSDALSISGKVVFERVIDQTFQWLQREMQHEKGAFYSALDADSEGVEGKYYVWSAGEVRKLLLDKYDLIADYYQIIEHGNWEDGNNILHTRGDFQEFLSSHKIMEEEFLQTLDHCNEILLKSRGSRIPPGLDSKVIASWNGLLTTGMVKAYQSTGENNYLHAAEGIMRFIRKELVDPDSGALIRVYGSEIHGVLEDYACVIDGAISLFQATFDPIWFDLAQRLTQYTMANFYDDEEKVFFYTDVSGEQLISRSKEIFDNVIPSSNSMMAENLRRMGILDPKSGYDIVSRKMLLSVKKAIASDVEYTSNWASTYLSFLKPTAEIAIVGPKSQEMGQKLASTYYPFKLIAGQKASENTNLEVLANRNPSDDGQTIIYVCFDKTCQLPVNTVDEALIQLPHFD